MENFSSVTQKNFDQQYFPVLFNSGEVFGLWPCSNKSLVSKLKAAFCVILVGCFWCSSFISAVKELYRGDFVLFASAAGPGLVTCNLLLKLGVVLWKWQMFIHILKDLRALTSYSSQETKAQKISRLANKFLLRLSQSTGVFYTLVPLILVALQYFNHEPLQPTLQTTSWWYWDIKSIRGYIPAYFLNVIVNLGVPYVLVFLDGLVLDISLYAGELFEDISNSLSSTIQTFLEEGLTHVDVDEFLNSILRRHLKAIEFCNTWKDLATEIVLIQFLSGVFEVCFGGFTLIVTEDLNTRYTYIAFSSAVITQAFFYCWGGQVLIESSLEVSMSLYSLPWYDMSTKTRKKLALMMTGAQIPIVLDVPFFEVSYPTFINILKASHGYITLLGTLM